MRLHCTGLMRTLASLGILTERPEQRFALTESGRGAEDRRAGLGTIIRDFFRQSIVSEWLGQCGLLY